MIGAAVVAGTAAAVGGMLAMANKTAEATDRIDKMSQKLGLSRKGFQEWDFIMSQSGTSIDSMQNGMKTLTNMFDDFGKGSKMATESFERLGLSYDDMKGMTQEQIFETTITALQGVESETERAALANDLLGRSGQELAPLLAAGAGSVEELKNKAQELGIVLGDDSVNAGVVFTDTMDQAKRSAAMLGLGIGSEVMPVIQKMLDWFIANMPQIKKVAGEAFDRITSAIGFVASKAEILIPILGGLFGAFMALKVISIISKLMSAYTIFTTSATGAQLSLSAAMMANPIGLVIAAMVALIAIGIAVYRNWDTIKVKALQLWSNIKTTFNGIKNAIVQPFTSAYNSVIRMINRIKSAAANIFKSIKLPKFRLSGSLNPATWIRNGLPKLRIRWNADGAIFDKPTIFDTPYGLQGVGDAKSPEVVAPIHKLQEMLDFNQNDDSLLLSEIAGLLKQLVSKDSNTYLDGKEVGTVLSPVLNSLINNDGIGRGVLT